MSAKFSSLQKKISFHTILIPLITVIEKIVPTTEGESLILHSTTNTDTLKRENPTFPEKASGSFPTPKQCSSTSHPCILSNKALQARFSSCGDRICDTVPFRPAVRSHGGVCFIRNEVSYKTKSALPQNNISCSRTLLANRRDDPQCASSVIL